MFSPNSMGCQGWKETRGVDGFPGSWLGALCTSKKVCECVRAAL